MNCHLPEAPSTRSIQIDKAARNRQSDEKCSKKTRYTWVLLRFEYLIRRHARDKAGFSEAELVFRTIQQHYWPNSTGQMYKNQYLKQKKTPQEKDIDSNRYLCIVYPHSLA